MMEKYLFMSKVEVNKEGIKMIRYDIDEITLEDTSIKIDNGYLNFNNTRSPKSWDIELYGTSDDSLFDKLFSEQRNSTAKVSTKDGKRFVGNVLITDINNSPSGTAVKQLLGTGSLNIVD
jgi:hypothetical protein